MHRAQQILETIYGYRAFRPHQEEIISHLIDGQDALVIMPTGGGKSLCYQIPSITRTGTGIVISPLIALMKDQVRALQELGVRAAFLNSSLSPAKSRKVKEDLKDEKLDILYLSPERLLMETTLNLISQLPISLIAIDEAHCVSFWGHDFRPEYMKLDCLAKYFPDIPKVALTATADEPTRNEIIEKLHLSSARQFIGGYDRPNIQYRVIFKDKPKIQLLNFIKNEHARDSGIVYCLSRKKVDRITEWLKREGFPAEAYHAGLSTKERNRVQSAFVDEDWMIVVATIAFGMGIDKPNVRFVAHMDIPKSIEAYYQETGRAGRDGLPSTAWMTYGFSDIAIHRQMIENSRASTKRKQIEHRKLTSLLAYAESCTCRREILLRYFSERETKPCGNCDTCMNPVTTWEGTKEAQMALSAIYRTGQRFGITYLTNLLRGNGEKRMSKFGHDNLSVFAIGKHKSDREWSSIFRQLVAMGYLDIDIEGYGGLRLTEISKEVLRGKRSIQLRIDHKKQAFKEQLKIQRKDLSHMDVDLFERLKSIRKELASEYKIAPYMVFHDKTLMEIAAKRPESMDEMRNISGVGDYKLKKYGEKFLYACRETGI